MLLFALSVFGLLLFLWVSFGGTLPLRSEGYRFNAEFPEAALLAKEADVRIAGVNVGKVKSTELGPGAQDDENRDRARRALRPDQGRHAGDPAHEEPARGDVRRADRRASEQAADLPEGGTLRRANVADTVELDEVFRTFDPKTRRNFQEWLHEAGILSTPQYAADLNDSLGNAAPFVKGGADLLRPLDEQEVALRRVVRDSGRTFRAISREDGQLRGLIVNGDSTFSALSSRDDALADTFAVLPTFLRETRTTVARLERFARDTDPLVRDLREPADDLAPTLRDLGDLSPDLEHLFRQVGPLVDASATGVPAATRLLRGAEPLLSSVHVFMPELNPILAYLSFSRAQVSQFLALGGSALGGTGQGGYRANGAGEHYLPQMAIIDSRSLQQRSTPPPWERANAYVAPNAYQRAIPLGVIESFSCAPAGGVQRDGSGTGGDTAPPCFVAPEELFQDQKYPRLRRGRAPVVDAPKGRAGNRPATP